jgi:hypothetical protein
MTERKLRGARPASAEQGSRRNRLACHRPIDAINQRIPARTTRLIASSRSIAILPPLVGSGSRTGRLPGCRHRAGRS